MKKVPTFMLFCCSIAVLAFAVHSTVPAEAAKKKEEAKADEIPLLARGFAGTLEGKIISRDDTGTTFMLKVKGVKTVSKYAQWNKARKPDALKGKNVLIHVRWFQDKKTKKYEPGEGFVRWVKELNIDRETSVDVYSDAYFRLIMVEAPGESK